MNPVAVYGATIEVGYPFKLRGTNQQTDLGFILPGPRMLGDQPTSTLTPLMQGSPKVGYFAQQNRSGSACVAGLGARLPNRYWRFGQWVDATTTFTDDTTDAQSTAAADVALETTTNNDGYVIYSPVRFNAISINVATASTGGTPARAIRYSNGTGWTTLTNPYVLDASGANYATGENIVVFAPPVDWLPMASSVPTGLRAGFYALNIRATTAPTGTAGVASAVEVLQVLKPYEALADNAEYTWEGPPLELAFLPETEGLCALFSVSDPQNRVTVLVRP